MKGTMNMNIHYERQIISAMKGKRGGKASIECIETAFPLP